MIHNIAETESFSNEKAKKLSNLRSAFSAYLNTPRWVCSNAKKEPINPLTGEKAKSNDPSTWTTFENAAAYCESRPDHLPTIQMLGGELCVIDLDDCLDETGNPLPDSAEIIEQLPSYTEVSRGGKGVHIFFIGRKPVDDCKKGGFEIYDGRNAHPMTVTGNVWGKRKEIMPVPEAKLEEACLQVWPIKEALPQNNLRRSSPMNDEEVLHLCRQAKNADKFAALYEGGDVSGNNGDDSAADLALCSILGFYTQDPEQIDRLFMQSALHKNPERIAKWARPGYKSATIRKALETGACYPPVSIIINRPLRSVGIGEFLKTPITPKPLILEPILREQDIQLIYARAGVGKTHLALNMAYAISMGGTFLNFKAPMPRRVLYIDGEMPEIQLQERLAVICLGKKKDPVPEDTHFQLLIATAQEYGLPYLDDMKGHGQEQLQPFFEKADVIFLDNLSALTANAEQDAKTWIPIQELLVRLRRQGKTVILVHHAGKNGDFRGTSRAIGIVDTVINLSHPKDYDVREGLRFEMRYQKARGVFGDAVDPLEIRVEEKNGIHNWTWTKLEERMEEKIKDLMELEMKDAEIIAELGISRATYYRHKKNIGHENETRS